MVRWKSGPPSRREADSVKVFLGLDTASVVVKNTAFMFAHPDELEALEVARMWVTP